MDYPRNLSRSETSGSVTGLFREADRNLSSPNGRLLNSHWCSPVESHSPLSVFYKSPIVSTPHRRTLGPLLASTHFNSNVSTYMDSKSPGLTERLVQYNNNTQECRATHQSKYGSPGVFPVVHLFKKNTLVRTPSKVTVHIGLQDSSLHSTEYATVAEDLTQHHGNGEIHYDHHESHLDSHSVLDALKEISRKRIQSGEQCLQPHDSCKRQRRECYTEQAKELSSSSITTNLPVHLPEVPCVMDAVTASLTSSQPYLVQPIALLKKKRKRAVAEKKSLHHVETQTDKLEEAINKKYSNNGIANTDASNRLEKDEDDFEKSSASQEIETQMFGNTPIETNKKAKLTILLSALTSPESTSQPYKQETLDKTKSVTGSSQIKVTSIISPQNKPKHNKHVTFAIPEKENIEDVPIIAKPNVSSNVLPGDENKETSNENLATNITTENLVKPESISNADILPSPIAASTSFGNIPVSNSSASLQAPVDMNFKNKPEPTSLVNKSNGNEQGFITAAPSSESLPLPKLGGFKFDFKDNGTAPNKSNASTLSESSTSFKMPFSSENFISTTSNNSLNVGMSSIVPPTNVSTTLGLHSTTNVIPQATNMNFNYGDSLKPNSSNQGASSTLFNSKVNNIPNYNVNNTSTPNFNLGSSQFGGNSIVTSAFDTNVVLSTGTGTNSTIKTTTTSPMSLPTSTSNISSVPIFAVSQPQATQPFAMNTSYASGFNFNTTTSVVPTTSSMAFSFATNTTTGYSVATTKLPPYGNNNASVTPTSTVFSVPLNKISNSAATSASGSHLTNPFNSSMFTNNSGVSGQFGPRPNQAFSNINQNTALGESTLKPNAFNTAVSPQTSNFGVRESNTNVSSFNAFGSTPQQKNSIFDSVVGTMPSQSGAFTFGTSSTTSLSNPAPGVFSFGGQDAPLTTEKFDLPNSSTISSSLNATPNSVFGSGAPPVFGSAANPFSVSANASFNPLVHSNPVTPKFDSSGRIFSIGAGATYSKSRTQLKARRRT